jgi:DNA-binding transcriptional LysR family regulator
MNLTLRQLRAFAAVAEAGSFTAAARQLHLTQSALSVLVRELEREMGVQLLDRHTRSVQLSDAGREFLPSVHRLLGDLAGAVAGVTDLRDKKKGVLRLAAPQLMACTLMPRVIALYRDRYPDVEVRLSDTLPEHLLAGVTAGDVELAVGQDVAVGGGANAAVERRTLLRDRHWLICPPGHAFARRRKVHWHELAPYTFIAPTRDFRQRVLPELAPAERAYMLRPGTQEVSYMTTALGMVASGLGLTVCPTYSAPLVRAHGLQMVRLESPDFHRDVCVYSAARRTLSPAAASFVEILEGFARAQPKA